MTLTRADLVQQVYKNHDNLTKAQATYLVEAFLRLSKDTLIKGSLAERVWKVYCQRQKNRLRRNPKTGDDLALDVRRVVTFKPSGILRKNRLMGVDV